MFQIPMFLLAKNSMQVIVWKFGFRKVPQDPKFMPSCKNNHAEEKIVICTLWWELRIACTVVQMEREGGISPRVSPLAQVRDAGNLLTRAGFTLPSVDVDQYTVKYNSDEFVI
ncbi:hypothetical protein WN943_015378 [Citrus x changshan-huyou]